MLKLGLTLSILTLKLILFPLVMAILISYVVAGIIPNETVILFPVGFMSGKSRHTARLSFPVKNQITLSQSTDKKCALC